jgi:hypothetical protein
MKLAAHRAMTMAGVRGEFIDFEADSPA